MYEARMYWCENLQTALCAFYQNFLASVLMGIMLIQKRGRTPPVLSHSLHVVSGSRCFFSAFCAFLINIMFTVNYFEIRIDLFVINFASIELAYVTTCLCISSYSYVTVK